MALTWTDKVNNVDDIDAGHINSLAHAIIDNEEAIADKADKDTTYTKDEVNTSLSFIASDMSYKADKTDTYTKTEIDSKITGVYKCKGTVSSYGNLPSTNQQTGDVYNVAEAYSKTFYGYNVTNAALLYLGFPDEGGRITLDSVSGFSAGDIVSVCNSGKTILGSFTVQAVDSINKQLIFEYATNPDYYGIIAKIKGDSQDSEVEVNKVYYFLGTHISSSTATQESIVKILYSAGGNVVWDGLTWDSLPGIIDFSDYYTRSQVDALIASAVADAIAALGV